jgi:hypothetical protein
MVASFLSFPKNQGEKSMTEERDCIFCWESDEPETLQPLFPGPGALSDVEPTAWVHKPCLEEYSSPPGLAKRIDVDDDDPEDLLPEDFVDEREEMDAAELWERVIADLTELERRTGGRDKSPTTAIIETCLKTRGALGRK